MPPAGRGDARQRPSFVYGLIRALATLLLRLFYRVGPVSDPFGALAEPGPVIYVSNHPNGLVDAGMLLILLRRQLTFLAKSPLFKLPVLGTVLRGVEALPVYRTQDDPAKVAQNKGVFGACFQALSAGGALTMFPEGKSHSEPRLAKLKSGSAHLALAALKKGVAVKLVPVGLNYDDKATYRSAMRMDVGEPIDVAEWAKQNGGAGAEQERALTARLAEALHEITLNLDHPDDLPILKTAAELHGGVNVRELARSLVLLREEKPEVLTRLKEEARAYNTFLQSLDLGAVELTKRRSRFVVGEALLLVLGLPLFLLGMAVFCIPYAVPGILVSRVKPNKDDESTTKMVGVLVMVPLWWTLASVLGISLGGAVGFLAAFVGTPALAFYTRLFFEKQAAMFRQARIWVLRRRQTELLQEGDALAGRLDAVVRELQPHLAAGRG
jgi:1-acyl-sn-glycerol-3-phosphate acyltransferase